MAADSLGEHVSKPGNAGDGAGTPDGAPAGPRRISRRRLILVDALIGLTTLLLIVGVHSVWANRLLFNPDNWSKTSSQLLQNPNVRNTTANYLVDQLYANVNVAGALKSGLPQQLQPLAAPAAGALRNLAVKGADLALTRPLVQNLWAQANRGTAQTFSAIVDGGKGVVATTGGVLRFNLA